MKKFLTAFVVCVLGVIFLTEISLAAPMVMKLGETHPQDYPTTKGDYEFARLVKERSNGRIVVEVFHSKQLGEEKAVVEQVQLGAIDFTRVSVSVTSAFVRELDALQLPYLYRDFDHQWKVLNGPIGQEILKNLGYEVEALTSSAAALEHFRQYPQQYDLAIVDLTMPQMTGVELARKLLQIRPGLPIILSSGSADKIHPEEIREIGIREVIMKPWSVRPLAEAIKKLLG